MFLKDVTRIEAPCVTFRLDRALENSVARWSERGWRSLRSIPRVVPAVARRPAR